MHLAETHSTEYLLEDGVLISRLKAGVKMTLDDVIENSEVRNTLPISFPLPFLMDIRRMKDITIHAIMATSSQDDVPKFSAAAILIDKLEYQIIAREASRAHSAPIPLKTFDDEEKALTWIRKYV